MATNTAEQVNTDSSMSNLLAGEPFPTPQQELDIFESLDDIVVETKQSGLAEQEQEQDNEFDFEDIKDDYEDGSGVKDALPDEDAEDEYLTEEEIENLNEEVSENVFQFAKEFTDLPDDLEFQVNGSTITKGDLSALVGNQEAVVNHSTILKGHLERMDALNTAVEASIAASETETSKQMKYLQQQLNSPTIGASQKGQLYEQYQALEQRSNVLQQETNQFIQVKQEREQQLQLANLANVSVELEKNYSEGQIQDVVQYALNQGIQQNDLIKNASVPLFEALIKAQKYDKTLSSSKQRIKERTQSKSISKPSAKRKAPAVSKQAKKTAAINKWKSGEISNVDAFSLIED